MSSDATLPAFVSGRATSREAAAALLPRLSGLQHVVLRALRDADAGLTDQQISQVTGLREVTARVRRIELAKVGLVVATDARRETASGRRALVWVAADAGPARSRQADLFSTAASATETGY